MENPDYANRARNTRYELVDKNSRSIDGESKKEWL
jgi:hypothetical protein